MFGIFSWYGDMNITAENRKKRIKYVYCKAVWLCGFIAPLSSHVGSRVKKRNMHSSVVMYSLWTQ